MMAFEILVFAHRDAIKQIPSACLILANFTK